MVEREDFRKSIGYFLKGVLFFFMLFDKKWYVVELDEDSSLLIFEKLVEMFCGEGKVLLLLFFLIERLKNFKLVEFEECKLVFLDVKVEFKKVYLIVIEVFNNEDLCLFDCI